MLAIPPLLKLKDEAYLEQHKQFAMTAGLLLGFALFTRIQLSFAVIGIAIWLLSKQTISWKNLLLMLAAGTVAIGTCVLIDHWFYGEWLFTPYNYYNVNVIQDVAAKYGTFPWWWYIAEFIIRYVPPVNLFLLIFFFYGITKKPGHLFSLVSLFFVAGHMLVAHKEMRFLLPILLPFIAVASLGFDSFVQKNVSVIRNLLYRIAFISLVLLNTGVLIYNSISPAEANVRSLKYINETRTKIGTTIVGVSDPYEDVGLKMNFYKPSDNEVIILHQLKDIDSLFATAQVDDMLFVSKKNIRPGDILRLRLKKAYAPLPDIYLSFTRKEMILLDPWVIYRRQHTASK